MPDQSPPTRNEENLNRGQYKQQGDEVSRRKNEFVESYFDRL